MVAGLVIPSSIQQFSVAFMKLTRKSLTLWHKNVLLSFILRNHFCCMAVPDLIWADDGLRFTSSKLKTFLQTQGFKHITLLPHYQQSSRKMESLMKFMKKIIPAAWTGHSVNSDIPSRALLYYRNTPCQKHGHSLAQIILRHCSKQYSCMLLFLCNTMAKLNEDAENAAIHTE